MLHQNSKLTRSPFISLPKIETRGLGIICVEGRNGTVEVQKVLPNSIAATTFQSDREKMLAGPLSKGDRIVSVTDNESKTRYPVNSPKKLAEAIEKCQGGGLRFEVIAPDGTKRSLYIPRIEPASTLGVSVYNSEKGVEVVSFKNDFAWKTLKLKEHDLIRKIKIGKEVLEIDTPDDLVKAIGKIVPGSSLTLIVDRYDREKDKVTTKVLSATAPKLSTTLKSVGGTSARL